MQVLAAVEHDPINVGRRKFVFIIIVMCMMTQFVMVMEMVTRCATHKSDVSTGDKIMTGVCVALLLFEAAHLIGIQLVGNAYVPSMETLHFVSIRLMIGYNACNIVAFLSGLYSSIGFTILFTTFGFFYFIRMCPQFALD